MKELKCPKCGELVGNNADVCFNCKYDFKAGEKEKKKQEEEALAEKLKINDLYEYEVVSVPDGRSGMVDINLLYDVLEQHGKDGWRLVNTFTNEIGKEAMRTGSYSTNATIDQTVLIFERCVKRAEK